MRRRVAALVLPLAAALGPASAAPAQTIPVQSGVTLSRDTVRVGDPFTVRVRVRAPVGARIEFPSEPDSSGTVQALDKVTFATAPDTSAGVDQTATYRVAAWDVGTQPVVLGDVVVRLGADERRVALGGMRVFVATVLPADTALRKPKPARPPFAYATPIPWWVWAAIAAGALLVIGLLVWWWRRKRRPPPAVISIDPYDRARRDFDRVERLGLVEAGERGRYVALGIEVMRDYLAARLATASLALTTSELLWALRGEPTVPDDRLSRLLTEGDLVKFARRPLTTERARELVREARGIVEAEHAAAAAAAAAAVPAPETGVAA